MMMNGQVMVYWKGVTYCLRDGKWFYLDYRQSEERWIGPFETLEDAIFAIG